jgi:hypothetical protein
MKNQKNVKGYLWEAQEERERETEEEEERNGDVEDVRRSR